MFFLEQERIFINIYIYIYIYIIYIYIIYIIYIIYTHTSHVTYVVLGTSKKVDEFRTDIYKFEIYQICFAYIYI